jgi:phosphoribosylaminoimidazolecarboxamide formyltransferase/IMP cyclohydrolase
MADSPIKRALVSVTDKSGVVEFVKALEDEFGVEVISTGGTAKVLADAGVHVVPIEEYTGFPEMMGGRVKTLHPMVHGGLLCRRDDPSHMADAEANGIKMIDLVCVNLYQFEQTVAKPDVTYADAIEHIDIGGPSMLRSAAKNHESVTVVSSPVDYDAILSEMRANGGATTLATRKRLALKVFTTTAAYDGAISRWMAGALASEGIVDEKGADAATGSAFPETFELSCAKQQDLRYGENPHQAAAFYRLPSASAHSLAAAEQLQGKPLSYNNLLDTDAAWSAVREFDDPAVIVLKHQNPCGSATAADITTAYDRAYACDPVSAYGGIIAANREVPLDLVEHFADVNKQFVEVIIAPSFTPEALERLAKRKNLRVLATGGVDAPASLELRSVDGGLLVQDVDHVDEDPSTFTVPTKAKPTDAQMDDLLFAWKVCKAVKSNAILVAKDRAGIGMGPGQPNRVDSALMACDRAKATCERMGVAADGMVVASDAFFPFRDDVITAIIQPGGSIRDEDVIKACDEHGIAMVFTGRRHFRH